MRLQHDELSIPARSLVPLLRGLKPARIEQASAIETLLAWDFVMNKESRAASIYATWEKHLKVSVRDLLVPKEAHAILPTRSFSTEKLIAWLTTPDGRFGADPIAGRDALLLRSLDRALFELGRRLGPERNDWQYGQDRLKHVSLKHPLSDAVNPQLRSRLDLGPLPRGGYGHTVNSTSDNDNQSSGTRSGSSPTRPTGTDRSAPTRRGNPATRTAPITATCSNPGPTAITSPSSSRAPRSSRSRSRR